MRLPPLLRILVARGLHVSGNVVANERWALGRSGEFRAAEDAPRNRASSVSCCTGVRQWLQAGDTATSERMLVHVTSRALSPLWRSKFRTHMIHPIFLAKRFAITSSLPDSHHPLERRCMGPCVLGNGVDEGGTSPNKALTNDLPLAKALRLQRLDPLAATEVWILQGSRGCRGSWVHAATESVLLGFTRPQSLDLLGFNAASESVPLGFTRQQRLALQGFTRLQRLDPPGFTRPQRFGSSRVRAAADALGFTRLQRVFF